MVVHDSASSWGVSTVLLPLTNGKEGSVQQMPTTIHTFTMVNKQADGRSFCPSSLLRFLLAAQPCLGRAGRTTIFTRCLHPRPCLILYHHCILPLLPHCFELGWLAKANISDFWLVYRAVSYNVRMVAIILTMRLPRRSQL